MEICLDCKDKVIKFYHFKRKVKEAQKHRIRTREQTVASKEKQSKIIHNIVEIVRDYTKKCDVSTIRVDESSKQLIIEPKEATPAAATSSSTRSKTFESRREIFRPQVKTERSLTVEGDDDNLLNEITRHRSSQSSERSSENEMLTTDMPWHDDGKDTEHCSENSSESRMWNAERQNLARSSPIDISTLQKISPAVAEDRAAMTVYLKKLCKAARLPHAKKDYCYTCPFCKRFGKGYISNFKLHLKKSISTKQPN